MQRNSKTAKANDYRPGTLGWYLSEAGWSPVEREKQHPLWEKDGQTLAAYDAWTIELRRIWKETRKGGASLTRQSE